MAMSMVPIAISCCGNGQGPGLRDERRSGYGQASGRARGGHALLLLSRLQGQVRGGAGKIPDERRQWHGNGGSDQRSRLRDDGRSAYRKVSRRVRWPHLLLLPRRVQGEIRGRSRALSLSTGAGAGAGGHHLHLPHASRDPAGWAGLVPDLRHGAGAGAGDRRGGAQPRAHRHDPPTSGLASS